MPSIPIVAPPEHASRDAEDRPELARSAAEGLGHREHRQIRISERPTGEKFGEAAFWIHNFIFYKRDSSLLIVSGVVPFNMDLLLTSQFTDCCLAHPLYTRDILHLFKIPCTLYFDILIEKIRDLNPRPSAF